MQQVPTQTLGPRIPIHYRTSKPNGRSLNASNSSANSGSVAAWLRVWGFDFDWAPLMKALFWESSNVLLVVEKKPGWTRSASSIGVSRTLNRSFHLIFHYPYITLHPKP